MHCKATSDFHPTFMSSLKNPPLKRKSSLTRLAPLRLTFYPPRSRSSSTYRCTLRLCGWVFLIWVAVWLVAPKIRLVYSHWVCLRWLLRNLNPFDHSVSDTYRSRFWTTAQTLLGGSSKMSLYLDSRMPHLKSQAANPSLWSHKGIYHMAPSKFCRTQISPWKTPR